MLWRKRAFGSNELSEIAGGLGWAGVRADHGPFAFRRRQYRPLSSLMQKSLDHSERSEHRLHIAMHYLYTSKLQLSV